MQFGFAGETPVCKVSMRSPAHRGANSETAGHAHTYNVSKMIGSDGLLKPKEKKIARNKYTTY